MNGCFVIISKGGNLGLKEIIDKVKCIDGDKIYYIPKNVFARVVMEYKMPKRFVRYKTGAELYDMSERQFQTLAGEAKARCKINRMVIVDLDILDKYLECFMEE